MEQLENVGRRTAAKKLAGGYAEIRAAIAGATAPSGRGSEARKNRRRERALTDLQFFAEAYFPHYLAAPPSKMHLALYETYQRAIAGNAALLECNASPRCRQGREALHSINGSGPSASPPPPCKGGRGDSPSASAPASGTLAGARIAEAAPRGNAKSTLTTLILPLWCVVGRRRRFIGILSDTTEQAAEFLEFIKAELETNERLNLDFPSACGEGPVWKTGHAVTANGVKIKSWGKRKRIRGARHGAARPDLVICDDLEDDEHIGSPEQREKDRSWFFRALMKIGARNTVYIVVGTLLHYDSLLARLLKQPGWTGRKWRAVIKYSASPLWQEWENLYAGHGPARMEEENQIPLNPPLLKGDGKDPPCKGGQGGILQGGENLLPPGRGKDGMGVETSSHISPADAFFEAHKTEMLAGTEVLWPEVEDYHYLMKMRVGEGPAFFDSEKQNEPINPNDCLFQEEWFAFVDEDSVALSLSKGEYTLYAAVDPSMGKSSRRADPSAIVVGGFHPEGYIDILEADIRKRHPDAIMEDLLNYHERYKFTRAGVEETQFQELFKDHLVKESARRGLFLPVDGIRSSADKTLRIAKLQPHIKNRRIRFRHGQRTLLDQLKYFPKAAHDDGPDALEMLFGLIAGKPVQPPQPRVRPLLPG